MNELATETAMARYGLKQRFQALSDCVEKDDGDLFLSARDAYFKYVRNSLILEKILDEVLLSKLIPSEDLPFEKRFDLDFMTDAERKKEFTAICQVHDILTKGLDETLSFAIPNNAKSEDTAYLHNSISAQSGQSVSQQNISKNNKTNLEKIWHIIVVKETNRTSRFIIINKNYPDAIEVKGRNFSKCVIALSEAILNKTKILEIDDILQCKDFLNKNFRCRIYKSHDGKKQKYNITDIVVTEKTFHEDEQLKITNAMKSEVITYADYQKRLNNYYASRQT